MGLLRRRGSDEDLDLIGAFGRFQLLGEEAAGEHPIFSDWYYRLTRWHEPLLAGPPARDRAIDRLNALAGQHGGWVAVGAWKLILEFCPSEVATSAGHPALVACVRAYCRQLLKTDPCPTSEC